MRLYTLLFTGNAQGVFPATGPVKLVQETGNLFANHHFGVWFILVICLFLLVLFETFLLAVSHSRTSTFKAVAAQKAALLEASESKFRFMVQSAPDAMVIVDANGAIALANSQAEVLFGYSQEELIGERIEILVPERFRSKHVGDRAGYSQDPRVRPMGAGLDLYALRKDGSEFPVEISLSPIKFPGGVLISSAIRDITERKKAEERLNQLLRQLESANKELNDFAQIVSHDLKAPLRGISTLAEWLCADYADKLDALGKEQLELIKNRVKRMDKLIDGILLYSRAGKARGEKTRVDLNELVRDAIDAVAPPENIQVIIENKLPVFFCGRIRMGQIFQNLIGNAIKFIDKPEGEIKIGCSTNEDFWKFYVSDNGPGIEEKYFDKIFQIFQTLSDGGEKDSTGIGLSVVKKIVEMYGGKIWLESKAGTGSTFLFTLPKRLEEGGNREK